MNKPRIEIPELTLFLSNGKFKESDIIQLLDELNVKYFLNIEVKHRLRFFLKKHNLKIPEHSFFDIYEKYSFKSDKKLNFHKLLRIIEKVYSKENYYEIIKKIISIMQENEFYEDNTFGSIIKRFKLNENKFSNESQKALVLSMRLKEYQLQNFHMISFDLINNLINKILEKIKDDRYQSNKIGKINQLYITPFYQSGERAYNEIKLVKNPGKIISINNK
jgi:hypothetical protein